MPRITINDLDFITAFHNSEPAAYEAVYREYSRSVRFFTEQLIQNTQAAEDIALETFTKAFQRTTDFKSVEKLKAFLFTTANNAALDYIKARNRHKRIHDQISHLQSGEMEDGELIYIRTEAIKAIHEAIDAIPGKPRDVVRMAFIEGKKLPEIAAELNISYNTVQNHRATGLQFVRSHLIRNKLLSRSILSLALSFLYTH